MALCLLVLCVRALAFLGIGKVFRKFIPIANVPITPADQAEGIYFISSDKASKTTGQVLNIDGGLHEAFSR